MWLSLVEEGLFVTADGSNCTTRKAADANKPCAIGDRPDLIGLVTSPSLLLQTFASSICEMLASVFKLMTSTTFLPCPFPSRDWSDSCRSQGYGEENCLVQVWSQLLGWTPLQVCPSGGGTHHHGSAPPYKSTKIPNFAVRNSPEAWI